MCLKWYIDLNWYIDRLIYIDRNWSNGIWRKFPCSPKLIHADLSLDINWSIYIEIVKKMGCVYRSELSWVDVNLSSDIIGVIARHAYSNATYYIPYIGIYIWCIFVLKHLIDVVIKRFGLIETVLIKWPGQPSQNFDIWWLLIFRQIDV